METLTVIALIGLGMIVDNLYHLYYRRQIRLAEQNSYLAGFQNGMKAYPKSVGSDSPRTSDTHQGSNSNPTPVRVSAEFESGLRKYGRAVQKLR